MSARSKPIGRLALVEATRRPPPSDYDLSPRNRKQRRQLAKALRQARPHKP
jgi:hypothetical protein